MKALRHLWSSLSTRHVWGLAGTRVSSSRWFTPFSDVFINLFVFVRENVRFYAILSAYWPCGFQSFKSEKSNEGKRLKVSYLLPTAHSGHLKKFRNFEKVSCFSYNQTCLIAYQTNDTKRETAPVPENLHALNEMYINWKWLTLTFLELIIN